jgi:hypothetical protein
MTATIDVHPPRAGRFAKSVRRVMPLEAARNRVFEAARRVRDGTPRSLGFRDGARVGALLLRLVIPGWSQHRAGHRRRGLAFFWTWVALLLFGMVNFGTTLGSLLLGLAFSVHVSAGIDFITQHLSANTVRRRIGFAIGFAALLTLAIYAPAVRMVTRFADPLTIQAAAGPFAEGDVVLVNHAPRFYQPGQLVLFDIGNVTQEITRHAYIIYTGDRIDRVIARGGDVVRWHEGQLFINDVESDLRPLQPSRLPARFSVTVPEGSYLIFPSTTPTLSPRSGESTWRDLSLVRAEKIQGMAYFRSHPLLHMKVLN